MTRRALVADGAEYAGSGVSHHLIEGEWGLIVHKFGSTQGAVMCRVTCIPLLLGLAVHDQAVIAFLHCGGEHLQVKPFPLLRYTTLVGWQESLSPLHS